MAELHVIRRGLTLRPAFDEDAELMIRLREGKAYTLTYKRARDLTRHRRFFALVTLVAERHPVFDNKEKALIAVKLAAGHCDFFPHPQTGELIPLPKSIAFDQLDEDAFQSFYQDAVQGILDHLALDLSREQIDQFVDEVCRF